MLGLYIYLYNTTSELYSRARLYARIPAAIFHSPARNSLAQAKITSVRSSHGGGSQPVAFGERFFFSLSSPHQYIYICYTPCYALYVLVCLCVSFSSSCVKEKMYFVFLSSSFWLGLLSWLLFSACFICLFFFFFFASL